jgi:hypothetical protein
VLSRHLPLARKTYAPPLSEHAEPLPDPLCDQSPAAGADLLTRSS